MIGASKASFCRQEGRGCWAQLLGYHQQASRYALSFGRDDRAVVQLDDVQDDRPISWIDIVMMLIPLARSVMDLHRPHPQQVIYAHLCSEEIRTSVRIEHSRVKNFNSRSTKCPLRQELSVASMRPYIM